MDDSVFDALVDKALTENIQVGFDSCSAGRFLKAVKGSPNYASYETMTEPCESGLFSTYIDVEGTFFPCSFAEGFGDWQEGLDVLNCEDFMKDIWVHPKLVAWRKALIKNTDENKCRNCPLFEV
jgi:radical SAM protein with 4Fe4S-binding SPASM domain